MQRTLDELLLIGIYPYLIFALSNYPNLSITEIVSTAH